MNPAAEGGSAVGTDADDRETARRWIDAGVPYLAVYADAPALFDVRSAFGDVTEAS